MISFLSFVFPLALYLGLPSTLWNFDGVACAAALELGQPAYYFHSNHLLFGFLGFLFWKGIGAPLGLSRALPALQLFTSLLSALGLIGLYRLLFPFLKNKWSALLLTTGLAFTASFWVWSVEAQVYSLGFLALAWATTVLVQHTRPRKYLWVGVLHGAAILGHAMHLLWIVPAVYWIYDECRLRHLKLPKVLWTYLVALGLTIGIPYLGVVLFVIAPGRDFGRVLIWMKGSAGLTPDRSWSWHWSGWLGPWIWLKSTLPSLWGSFGPYGNTPVTPWMWALTLISVALFVTLFVKGWKGPMNRAARFSLLWLGVYGIFLSTWEPATLCYRLTDVLPLGILLALGLRTFRPSLQVPLAALFLGSTLALNFSTLARPMNQPEKNQLYQDTLTLSKMSSPDSLYISNGGLPWLYLLYFTGRMAWNAHAFDSKVLSDEMIRQKRTRPVYIQEGTQWHQI